VAYPVEAAHNSHAKVSNLKGARAIAKDIIRLDVHDYHPMAVQEIQPLHLQAALKYVRSHIFFVKTRHDVLFTIRCLDLVRTKFPTTISLLCNDRLL